MCHVRLFTIIVLASVRADDAVRESRPAEIEITDLIRPLPIEIETEAEAEAEVEAEVEAACEDSASQIEVVEIPEIEVQLPEVEVEDVEVEACVAESKVK